MSKKASNFSKQAAERLYTALKSGGLLSDFDETSGLLYVEAELCKILLDYTHGCLLSAQKKESDITEYELLLLKHKNKQTFLVEYTQRTGCNNTQAEKIYNSLRQKVK